MPWAWPCSSTAGGYSPTPTRQPTACSSTVRPPGSNPNPAPLPPLTLILTSFRAGPNLRSSSSSRRGHLATHSGGRPPLLCGGAAHLDLSRADRWGEPALMWLVSLHWLASMAKVPYQKRRSSPPGGIATALPASPQHCQPRHSTASLATALPASPQHCQPRHSIASLASRGWHCWLRGAKGVVAWGEGGSSVGLRG